jgi:hypothetical protein
VRSQVRVLYRPVSVLPSRCIARRCIAQFRSLPVEGARLMPVGTLASKGQAKIGLATGGHAADCDTGIRERWLSGLKHRFAKPAYGYKACTAGSNPALSDRVSNRRHRLSERVAFFLRPPPDRLCRLIGKPQVARLRGHGTLSRLARRSIDWKILKKPLSHQCEADTALGTAGWRATQT